MTRYLLVGAFNTVFGYGLFALLNWLLRPLGAHSYLLAALLANVIAIGVAFLGYKKLVFRSQGNYLGEWARCMCVYGSSMLISLAGLAVLVPVLQRSLRRPEQASYLAAAIMTVLTIILSFLGHKHFSFHPRVNPAKPAEME